jgi:hypothetical protein
MQIAAGAVNLALPRIATLIIFSHRVDTTKGVVSASIDNASDAPTGRDIEAFREARGSAALSH